MAAKAVVEAARILPAEEEILRRDALVGSVLYSNAIEDNPLGLAEAGLAADHELDRTAKAQIELINYVSALEWVSERHDRDEIEYTPEFLKTLHGVMTRGLGRIGTRFEPHHEGEWRDKEVAVANAIQVFHEGAPKAEVPRLMQERLNWLENRRTNPQYSGAILAGVAHFEVAEVHPFADYNGRTARLFTVAVLMREGVIGKPLFSPERYYADDKDAYLRALRSAQDSRPLDDWLSYFVEGLAREYERVARRVEELSELTGRLQGPRQLSPSQEKIIAELTATSRRDISRAEAEALTGLAKTKTYSELKALVDLDILRTVGAGKLRVYRLAHRTPSKQSSKQARVRWTDELVRIELRALADSLGRWPSRQDFLAGGRNDLYVAASKAGGIGRWAKDLGY